jgi:N,N'-diacetyllegionaminate synthase
MNTLNSRKPYNILEVANVHSGNVQYILDLIDEFSEFSPDYGMKFQPFRYDMIALPDYEWYNVYKELFISPDDWQKIFLSAVNTKDVWIDVFDGYSFEILKENIKLIHGLKFQASTLSNILLINTLSTLDLSDKKIIINVSGYSTGEIQDILQSFHRFSFGEIILQIGFQAYPTNVVDSGLSKIQRLINTFDNRISFADHLSHDTLDASILPVCAFLQGADILEKHIRLSQPDPKYDFYSSLSLSAYKQYHTILQKYAEAQTQPFINENEKIYLTKTMQIPVLGHDLPGDSIPDLNIDFEFKRSNREGISVSSIKKILDSFQILKTDKKKGDTIREEDFRKAKIGAVIACRLKSTRLPQKALKKIGDLTSVELCIRSTLELENINTVVLATSDLEEDSLLENYLYRPTVMFHKGHPVDVMHRVLEALDKYCIDIFIRITADMPFVSNDILKILLASHFNNGADYTRANEAAIGTNLEIINKTALRKAKSYFPNADYSEYMTYYFINNPDHFKLNIVTLPDELVRDYRLTLDYPEDLELFNKIHDHLVQNRLEFSIRNIFSFLDNNPELANINNGCEVRYKTDKNLIETLNRYTRIIA